MQDFIKDLLFAVVTAAVPVLTGYAISLIKKAGANTAAKTEDTKVQGYVREICEAISDAVAATSQTYVDALKQAGKFDKEAQQWAAKRALAACLASISTEAQDFIVKTYGDISDYLKTKIEAEVRKQKVETPLTIGLPAAVESSTDTTAIAASTAAATAATIAQTAISQLSSEPAAPVQTE